MTRPVYRVSEVATMLTVSPDFLWARIRAGALRAKKLGRYTVVAQADLDAFLADLPTVATNAVQAASEQPQEQPKEARRPGPRQRVQRRISLLPTGSAS